MTRTALSSLAPAPGLPRLRSLPWQRLPEMSVITRM